MSASNNLCLLHSFPANPGDRSPTPKGTQREKEEPYSYTISMALHMKNENSARNVIYCDTQLLSNQIKPMFLNVTLIFQSPLKPSKTDTALAIVTHTHPNTTQSSVSPTRVGFQAGSLQGLTKIIPPASKTQSLSLSLS